MSTLHGMVWASVLGFTSVAQAADVAASSALTDDEGVRRDASAAVDGRLSTSWCEDETGDGVGSWLELRLAHPTTVTSLSLWPGDLSRGVRSLKETGRPHTVTVLVDGAPVAEGVRLRDGAEHGEQRVDVPLQVEARTIRVRADEAYGGYLHNDTCIAEVAVNFASGEQPSTARLDGWVASNAGQEAAGQHRSKVIALFDRVDQSQFGDRDALAELMDFASDGAPWLRERVRREVPAGFRVAALPPDEVALEALLKLKDPNAIPAVTLASLRSTGERQRELEAVASYFQAFAELKGGGRRSIGDGGAVGWERGALRSFGEPFGMSLGPDGLIYVADVANHRVARFTIEGRPDGAWGAGEPTVTDAWFGGRREHYVAGRQPSAEPGGFVNPLAIATTATRDGLRAYVLDASKRVQVLDEAGEAVAVWKVPAELGASPGVGGAAHLLLARKAVVVIWGNEGFVLSPDDGTLISRWTIQDGAPITATVLRNGKLALGFTSGAAIYGLDGFRHATLLDAGDLPLGYEGWALGTDDKGRLWAVTDHGWAIKYKRPGVVDYQVRWNEVGVRSPRFVVEDDILWILADGRIKRVDALEAKVKDELAAAEE